MKMNRNEKILIIGATGIGMALLYKKYVSPSSDNSGEGQFGGEDELTEQQGFDIDPNVAYPVTEVYDPYAELSYANAEAGTQSPSEPNDGSPVLNNNNNPVATKTLKNSLPTSPNSLPTSPSSPNITLPQYGLGALGLTGSYATSLGKALGEKWFKKGSVATGESILKRTAKEGIKDIPFAGKKASEFVFKKPIKEVAEKGAKGLAEKGAKGLVKKGAKGLVKKGVKTTAKAGLSAIPFIGLGAGAEFDVAVDKRSRPLAYTANIAGDILGALAVVGGALVGVSETGVGAVALDVGGQVAGEQGVYKTAELLGIDKKPYERKYTGFIEPKPYFFENVRREISETEAPLLSQSGVPSSGAKNGKVSREPIVSTSGLGAGTNKAIIINKAIKQGYSVKEAQAMANKSSSNKSKKKSKSKSKSKSKTTKKVSTTTRTSVKVKKSSGQRDMRASSYKKKAQKRRKS